MLDSISTTSLSRLQSERFTDDREKSAYYISTLVCLFYRYQPDRLTEIVFHWYHESSGSPQQYTLTVEPDLRLTTCMNTVKHMAGERCDRSNQAMFAIFEGCTGERFESDPYNYDCMLLVHGDDAQLCTRKAFPHQAMHVQAEHILEQFNKCSDTTFSEVEVLSKEEQAELVLSSGSTQDGDTLRKPIYRFVEEIASMFPGKHAVLSDYGHLTYLELNQSANQLARIILEKAGTAPQAIAVDLQRGPSIIVALLAILKAGHYYLPIDQNAPTERIQFMLEDCKCYLHLCDMERTLPPGVESMRWDHCLTLMKAASKDNLNIETASDPIAYINYTSGSTGVPKGVEVYHRGVVRLNYKSNFIDYDEHSRMLQLSNIGFDAATFEIWGALMNAIPLVVYSGARPTVKGLIHHIQQFRANTTFLTTSLFDFLIDEAPHIFSQLRYVIFGGDKISIKHTMKLRLQYPELKLVQAYGPTECTTFATTYSIEEVDAETPHIPIGKPINETQVYLLDDYGRLVPPGVHGEMYIGGMGVAKGYRNQLEKTQMAFVTMRGPLSDAGILYRTGDMAYRLPSGDLVFVGRRDDQIKIRGYRVELGEITSTLSNHPKIAKVYTALRGEDYSDKQIVVYYTPEKNCEISAQEIKEFAKVKLPTYMVPSQLIHVSQFPLTSNGKIDKARVGDFRVV